MSKEAHCFHIPVMGTGHSIDTPIRVAHLGISSVISLVDDILVERIGTHYRERFGLPAVKISRSDEDGRAQRVTAYLDTVHEIVRQKFAQLKALPLGGGGEKDKYFELLPEDSALKQAYQRWLGMGEGPQRDAVADELTAGMRPGSIDVNIMVKLDRTNYDKDGQALPEEFSDSLAALRGFAKSKLESKVILSAGINQKLFSYISRFKEFYRDQGGRIRKEIVIKVSDFRSALLQAKVLAKKGLEVAEFRVESGLNCGGHAFAANGLSLPCVLREFRDKLEQITATVRPLIAKYYEAQGTPLSEEALATKPRVSVQGGIGTHGEVLRLREEFGVWQTGWGTPFLLVSEATCVDDDTRELLRRSGASEYYLSDVSPLGIPFNNVRSTPSELRTRRWIEDGKPGSPCPKGFLVSSTEFSERPLCPASRAYQKLKLEQIGASNLSEADRERQISQVLEKTCICDHLGNGALIALGIVDRRTAPASVCPGPNLAWFNETYSLRQMVDHIYGRGPSLVPKERPHMFANEMKMVVDYFAKQIERSDGSAAAVKTLREFERNVRAGFEECRAIATKAPFANENLASIPVMLANLEPRLEELHARLEDLAANPTQIGIPA